MEPKPDRPIPIWLGTYGKRALEVTGRLADGWIPSLGFAPPEEVKVMRDRVVASARAAGRDPREIRCIYNVGILVDERAEPQPDVVAGPPDAVVQRLLSFLRIGFAGLNFISAGGDEGEQVER